LSHNIHLQQDEGQLFLKWNHPSLYRVVFDIRQCGARKIPVHKIQIFFMIWVTVVLHRCKCSSFVAFCGDDTDAPIYCTSCTKIMLGDIPCIALIFSRLSSDSTCLLWAPSLSKMEPTAQNLSCICKLSSCLEQLNQETSIHIYDPSYMDSTTHIYHTKTLILIYTVAFFTSFTDPILDGPCEFQVFALLLLQSLLISFLTLLPCFSKFQSLACNIYHSFWWFTFQLGLVMV
jgi:hypothetical protein